MKKKVIIDCDPGIDDSLALMLALSMEELDVLGITVVCGNCPVEMGAANAKKVLKYMKRLDVPVYKGADRPLKREYVSALDTHGSDGLGESFLPEVEGYEQEATALEFLEKTIKREHCSVIALGPLTNLAELILKSPESFEAIGEIISMGGNFRSHGNCSPVAEYNYWADPDGASLVYKEAWKRKKKIHMVGLDVTRKIVLTPNLLEYIKRLNPETGRFAEAITKFYFDFHWKQEHLIGCVINDPLAVAYFVDRSLCAGLEAYTAVETKGISIGQTVVDSMGFYHKRANAYVLTQVDSMGFFRLFFKKILKISDEELDLLENLEREE
ncbi:nucleoside hydrolase [Lachnospiraceae bacterium 62-35]